MGRVRSVLIITAFSVVTSLVITIIVCAAFGLTDRMVTDLLIATIVPLIVAPLASGAAMGLLVEVESARAELVVMAARDALTQLYNRRFFTERLDAEIERARRESLPLTLLLVDIDHFKQINDTYGHAAGDQVLQQVAQILQLQARPYDVSARIGGEEFVLMLPAASIAEGFAVAERVLELVYSLRVPFLDPASTPHVTVSVGVASLNAAPDDADAFLRRADAAMYQAKNSGRNRVVVVGATA